MKRTMTTEEIITKAEREWTKACKGKTLVEQFRIRNASK